MKIERISLAKGAPEQAEFAAVELRYYLSLMTGKSYQIEEEAAENAVILDQTDDYGIDGFALIPEGDCLCIRGGKRGILYGTYEFLERLGCRFFTPECEKVPTAVQIDLNIKEAIIQKPVFEYREHNYRDIVEHPRFAVKSRINGRHSPIPEKLGGHMSYVWFVHSFDRMIPPDVYGESHPEFFAMRADGTRPAEYDTCQLCLTNPDLLEEAIKNVRKVLQENPEHKIISLSQNDNYENCQCEKCRASDKEEGSPSGTLLKFINGIAERLEPEFPDVIFDTLAYVYGRPAPKVTKPRPNVCVRLCSIEECFAHPFGKCDDESRKVERPDGTRSSFVEDLQEWSRICNRMHIWDYTTCFAHYPSPHPNWHCLQPNMQLFVRNGVKGVYEQANRCKGGGVDLNELRAYIIGKLLWDPDTDVKKHMEEFTDYYYGAGGVYIREYIETLCGKAEKDNIHVGFNDEPVSELFAEEMLDIYDAILKKAEEAVYGDALRMRRVQKVQLSTRYIRLKRKGMFKHIHDAEEINKFYEDWTSYGLTRIDEWVGKQGTLRALLEDEWRGVAYLSHFTAEGPEIL